ncbi:hypothetical protein C8F04DRAFT_1106341 [Mycena alexandri]|uniref:Uncharacterized protein n=1 Tax=Mycena alexandri TaxID=1745969 RepID=A0AAD6SRW9_9AGAR|nr:hypothetical protein C8F04DRAFT_1106341 [Mycena alexandri]
MEYYQLGGFEPAVFSSRWPPLAEKVYRPLQRLQNPNGPNIELVLGIKRSGTSHLLLTDVERHRLFQERNIDLRRSQHAPPTPAREFESLSPIVFRDVSELSAKLAELQPKNEWDKNDTSRLNKGYSGGNQGAMRAQFENSRVFYRLLRNELKKERFCCEPWSGSIRVLSFCYNLWLLDSRSLEDRRRSPRILDLAWCEAENGFADGGEKQPLEGDMKTSEHIVFANNQRLTNPGKARWNDKKTPPSSERQRYEYDEYGATQTCDPQAAAEKVRTFFGTATQPARGPLVLLVHDKANALAVLTSLGVDVSRWDSELKNLIRVQQTAEPRRDSRDPRRPYHDSRGSGRDFRRSYGGDSRRRSASPGPHDPSRRKVSPPPPPPPPRQFAPVYIVDVQSMFRTMLGTHDDSESVPAIIERLMLRDVPPKGFCAGNECWMLVETFRRMAAGRPIDDQKADWPHPPFMAPLTTSGNADYPGAEEEQSDYAGSDSE